MNVDPEVAEAMQALADCVGEEFFVIDHDDDFSFARAPMERGPDYWANPREVLGGIKGYPEVEARRVLFTLQRRLTRRGFSVMHRTAAIAFAKGKGWL